jgi:hypothetical protein
MAGSLSMASTAVLSAEIAVIDPGVVAELQCIADIIIALEHCLGVCPH